MCEYCVSAAWVLREYCASPADGGASRCCRRRRQRRVKRSRARVHWLRGRSRCWKNRMQNVSFDTAHPLPHPARLCPGSLGFMVRDYSRPQKQLLKPPIKADSCCGGGWQWRPTVGAQNMQVCRTMEANSRWREDNTAVLLVPRLLLSILPGTTYCSHHKLCK